MLAPIERQPLPWPYPVPAPLPIIAFAKDWHEDPTSNHHVLRHLARSRRVLWLNSVATRTPKLSSGRDLRKIGRKVRELAHGAVNVEHDLWVFTPLVLPFPHSAAARAVNQRLLRATVRAVRLRLGIGAFHLWTFLPGVADYVGLPTRDGAGRRGGLGEALAVYYCVDEWSMFSYLDRQATVTAERRLLERVDCVFAINHALAESKRAINPETHVAPHGVDHAAFAAALTDTTAVPPDLAALPGPRLGFYGTIQDWVDLELLAEVARARPSWSIVLLGQVMVDTSPVRGLGNVHLLGRKPHDQLAAYCKGFDVGLIPYRLGERMRFVNPIKLREYLAAGLPVVSTAVPEAVRMAAAPDEAPAGAISIAGSAAEVVAAATAAMAADSPAARAARSAAMAGQSWAARVDRVARIVDDVAARRSPLGA